MWFLDDEPKENFLDVRLPNLLIEDTFSSFTDFIFGIHSSALMLFMNILLLKILTVSSLESDL